MDVAAKARMTVEEFLAWDDEQEGRHEFDGEKVIEMVGGAYNHEIIVSNLNAELVFRLRGGEFRPIGSGFRLRAGPAVRLPDVQVNRHITDGRATISDQAVAVFEVLSPSTAQTDRFKKAENYWATPSIQHFVLIEQAFAGAVVLSRGPLGWTRTTVEREGVLNLPAIGVSLPLVDLYRDVSFPVEPSSDAG